MGRESIQAGPHGGPMIPWLAVMLLAMSTGVGAQDPATQDAKETKTTAPPGANAENTSTAGSSAGKTRQDQASWIGLRPK